MIPWVWRWRLNERLLHCCAIAQVHTLKSGFWAEDYVFGDFGIPYEKKYLERTLNYDDPISHTPLVNSTSFSTATSYPFLAAQFFGSFYVFDPGVPHNGGYLTNLFAPRFFVFEFSISTSILAHTYFRFEGIWG